MTGFKSVLVERVIVCVAILFFEDELDAKIFQQFHSNSVVVPSFDSLPEGPSCKENSPVVKTARCYGLPQVKEATNFFIAMCSGITH